MGKPHKLSRPWVIGLPIAVALLIAGCGGSSASGTSANGVITIHAQAPADGGPITSSENAALAKYTAEYEKSHPKVKVDWEPLASSDISTSNSELTTEAAAGDAPDLVWEQYGPLLAGSVPTGILQNIKSYYNQPDPYVNGNKKFLDLFSTSVRPYLVEPNGDMEIVLGSSVETGFIYSKAAFAKAGIEGTPSTWAEMMTDMAALKKAGITPLSFADGNVNCNPSWYERLATTSLLQPVLSKFMVKKAQVSNGLDDAVGIERGVISMSNPRYAEVWKLFAQMRPYFSAGSSSYDVCATPNTSTPPLSNLPLLMKGKVGMIWGVTVNIPQLNAAGFGGKYGVFAEPAITAASTSYGTDVSTKGVIGGPNGHGQWSVTSERADHTMTPAKTKAVMNFVYWLFTPQHLGAEVKDWGDGGAFIPTEPAAPTADIAGISSLVPSKAPATVVDVALDDVLSSNTSSAGGRLIQSFVTGGTSFAQFSSQWQSLLESGAQAWASQNHVDLSQYK